LLIDIKTLNGDPLFDLDFRTAKGRLVHLQ